MSATHSAATVGAMIPVPKLLSILLLLAATSCAGGQRRAGEELQLAARDYHDALQYGDFQVIARYLPFEERAGFLSRAFAMENALSVVEFLPVGTDFSPGGERALMVTRLSWFELPSTVVRTENVLLHWRHEGGGLHSAGTWILERIEGGPLPVGGGSVGKP